MKNIKTIILGVVAVGVIYVACFTDIIKTDTGKDLSIQAAVSLSVSNVLEVRPDLRDPIQQVCDTLTTLIDARTVDTEEVQAALYKNLDKYTGNKDVTVLLVAIVNQYNLNTEGDMSVEEKVKRLKSIRNGLRSALLSTKPETE